MTAECALMVIDALAARNIDVWLDGGWCIDALVGTQRRSHDDLDVVSRLEDCDAMQAILGEQGFRWIEGGPPTSFYLVDPTGHQVDVHPVVFDANGDGLYDMGEGMIWPYPARGFAGTGTMLGREVRCLTAEVMMLCHSSGYVLDDVHVADVVTLSEVFGITLPPMRTTADEA
jgi:lincosamide nucleotidyltransferase A/C/D/E